jgi:DNA polymerase III sliding clamp (beta) subunit (PCNA family)
MVNMKSLVKINLSKENIVALKSIINGLTNINEETIVEFTKENLKYQCYDKEKNLAINITANTNVFSEYEIKTDTLKITLDIVELNKIFKIIKVDEEVEIFINNDLIQINTENSNRKEFKLKLMANNENSIKLFDTELPNIDSKNANIRVYDLLDTIRTYQSLKIVTDEVRLQLNKEKLNVSIESAYLDTDMEIKHNTTFEDKIDETVNCNIEKLKDLLDIVREEITIMVGIKTDNPIVIKSENKDIQVNAMLAPRIKQE